MGVILDSSVLIAAERGALDLPAMLRSLHDEPVALAALSASELLHGCERAKTAAIRARRSAFVERVLALLPVAPFGLVEARSHAALWSDLAASGNLIGPHDLVIAATALARGFRLATLNRREFERVSGLTLVSTGPFLLQP